MPARISCLADVDHRAQLGEGVVIGPFCRIGPHVNIGDGTILDSHVTVVGNTVVGKRNRFFPCAVIGAEPQDVSYRNANTCVVIGDDNVFREGVTVNRGAEKEDETTSIGNRNLLMANCHIAHNCRVADDVILVNGVLLGGHVHVHDGAIVSGNTAVHHYSTLGTLSFVSGGCRVPHDIPPFMLASGSDHPSIRTINLIGLRRRGVARETIRILKRAHRLFFREHKPLEKARAMLLHECGGNPPGELVTLLEFVGRQQSGRLGRAREAFRNQSGESPNNDSSELNRRAA